ncbi:hypothetical protein E2C01_032816 [Portunus trituberculatus]|uniref:Uncharacterized protein n=1 Tax=Portunus trituberculatus TaxID=210409 RepID=A0A5B7F0L9_PORTR|nr:hypothetical protein [Portunus trituberculatus]
MRALGSERSPRAWVRILSTVRGGKCRAQQSLKMPAVRFNEKRSTESFGVTLILGLFWKSLETQSNWYGTRWKVCIVILLLRVLDGPMP